MPDVSAITRWLPNVEQWCKTYTVLLPIEALSSIGTESSGNPNAYNPGDPSWGLMGVEELIAHAFGGFEPGDISWHTDPDKNLEAGMGFLAHLKAKYAATFPNYGFVAGYNEGETQLRLGKPDLAYVNGWLERYQWLKDAGIPTT